MQSLVPLWSQRMRFEEINDSIVFFNWCFRRGSALIEAQSMKPTHLPKKLFTPLALAAALLLAGCVVTSIYPYFTDKDVVFAPELVGAWQDVEPDHSEKEFWKFEKSGDKNYKFTVQDGDKATTLDAHLFKLKSQIFLDACPDQRPDDLIPPHYLLKMTFTATNLQYSAMDYEWLEKHLTENPGALRHHLVSQDPNDPEKKRLILTANTAELQSFVLKHLTTEGAFSKSQEMKRRP